MTSATTPVNLHLLGGRCARAILVLLCGSLIGCGALSTVDLSGPNEGEARMQDKRKFAGRVAVSKAPAAIAAAAKTCETNGVCKGTAPISVGHSLAGFRSYPVKVTMAGAIGHGWRGQKTAASDVIALMDRAFSARLNLDAVHLNAYSDPAVTAKTCRNSPDKPCAYITQREPPWSRLKWDSFEESRQYLARNTLGAALSHFAKTHAPKGKHLFIQLHEPNACAIGPGGEHRCHQRISNVVRRVLAIDGPTKKLGQTIAFTSLSRHALEVAHNQAEDMGLPHSRVKYVLLTGSHFAGSSPAEARCGIVAASSQVLEKARRTERKWMRSTAWLDAVWVQPRCFTTAGKVLAAVNAARASHTPAMQPLTAGIATHTWPHARTATWLKDAFGTTPSPAKVSSFIYAIDED